MTAEVRVIGIDGIPEARPGDDVVALIASGIEQTGLELEAGDIVVVTHKLVSKAEGRLVDLSTIQPASFARQWAARYDKDPRQIELVIQESRRIVRMNNGVIIAETPQGFICANGGVDASNVAEHVVALLPVDPDASASRIRSGLAARYGLDPAVIITDSFGRPWRKGIVNVAIGSSGIQPLLDYRGQFDDHGYELRVTVLAIADEIASASELVMGKLERRPAAIVRGYQYQPSDEGATALVMEAERDLFR